MRVAERQINVRSLRLGPITHTVNFKHPRKTLAHALRHVGDQLAHQTVPRPLAARIAGPLHHYLTFADIESEPRLDAGLELAFRPFNLEGAIGQHGLDAFLEHYR